jgi:hypothetical protein
MHASAVSKNTLFATLVAVLCAVTLTLVIPSAVRADTGDPEVEVQFLVDGEQGSGFLLVTGTLPESDDLPAVRRLPLPEGAELCWAGELAVGGPEGDIQRLPSLVEGEGGLAVEFSLETTRVGQYDALYLPTIVTGNERQVILRWVQSTPAAGLRVSVRMPAGADVISMDPLPVGDPAVNRLGETLYALPGFEADLGEVVQVSVDFTQGSLLDTGSSGSVPSTLAVLGAVVLVLLVVLVLVVRSHTARRASEGDPVETLD